MPLGIGPASWGQTIMRRIALIAATGVLCAGAVLAARAAELPVSDQGALEKAFDASIHSSELRDWMKTLASEPNHVGSPHDKANAEWILAQFRKWGWDAHIETFEVLYPTPIHELLELLGVTKFKATLQEPPLKGDTSATAMESRKKICSPARLYDELCFFCPQENLEALQHPRVGVGSDSFVRNMFPRSIKETARNCARSCSFPCTKTKPYLLSPEHLSINAGLVKAGFRPTTKESLPEAFRFIFRQVFRRRSCRSRRCESAASSFTAP